MSFYSCYDEKRTDFSFRNQLDPQHHKVTSILEQLPVDMINDFPTSDPLHLLELGMMKKLLKFWLSDRQYLTNNDKTNINTMLIGFNSKKPTDFNRSFRSSLVFKYWKGVEFRQFLLYAGIVVLKDELRSDCYQHFIKLFCAVTICYCNYYKDYINLAEEEFNEFIEEFADIYGRDQIVSNVHNLCHITADVRRFGPLSSISSYPFENLLGTLKTRLAKSSKPLEQIARRIAEENFVQRSSTSRKIITVPLLSHRFEVIHDNVRSTAFKSILITEGIHCIFIIKEVW